MRRTVRFAAASCVVPVLLGLASCGQNAEQKAAEQEKDKQAALEELGEVPLKDGMTGSCVSDDPRLPFVKLTTVGQYLGIEIGGYDQVQATDFYSYEIMLTNKNGKSWQVALSNYLNANETNRSVFNMQTGKNLNYPGWNDSDDSSVFSTNLPDTAIRGAEGTKWQATLTTDGDDVATCLADGDAKLE